MGASGQSVICQEVKQTPESSLSVNQTRSSGDAQRTQELGGGGVGSGRLQLQRDEMEGGGLAGWLSFRAQSESLNLFFFFFFTLLAPVLRPRILYGF